MEGAAGPGWIQSMAGAGALAKPRFEDFSASYGASQGLRHTGRKAKDALPKTEKVLQVALNMILPPFIFFLVLTLLSFSFRYNNDIGVWSVVMLALLPVWFAFRQVRNARSMGLDSGWPMLLLVLCSGALKAAVLLGQYNYWNYSQPAFFWDTLKEYTNLDPTGVKGERLLDAGLISFSKETRVQTDLAMSYTNKDVYCVAPISRSSALPAKGGQLDSYDLWAVGVNCCTSGQTNFKCGASNVPVARGGMRVHDEALRPYFRLAVQQAEAAYDIQSKTPLFFYWVEDPKQEQTGMYKRAFANWVAAIIGQFGINLCCIVIFCWVFQQPNKDNLSVLES